MDPLLLLVAASCVLLALIWLLSSLLRPKLVTPSLGVLPKDPFLRAWVQAGLRYGSSALPTFHESETAMRAVLREMALEVKDFVRHPNGNTGLFLAHRHGVIAFEGGLGIRLTVHYNLFCGTVANLGNEAQRDILRGILRRAEIGCFALTEARAGVLSGLLVDTEARLEDGMLVLHTPDASSAKRWISNGLVADWGVVVARLIVAGKDLGPHALLVDMNTAGITRVSMEEKVAFNGLDNAVITFNHVRIDPSALLGASLARDGSYQSNFPGAGGFLHMAQRLLSGRIALAGAALGIVRQVCVECEEYAQQRVVPVGRDVGVPLAQLPSFRDTVVRVKHRFLTLSAFVEDLENRYVSDATITDALVEAVAVAKIECVAFALEAYGELRKAVGSFSVLGSSPFGARLSAEALLYCIRFAEGDSAVLMQKIARDSIKLYRHRWWMLLADCVRLPVVAVADGLAASFSWARLRLAWRLLWASRGGETAAVAAWLEAYQLVDRVASLRCQLTIRDRAQ